MPVPATNVLLQALIHAYPFINSLWKVLFAAPSLRSDIEISIPLSQTVGDQSSSPTYDQESTSIQTNAGLLVPRAEEL